MANTNVCVIGAGAIGQVHLDGYILLPNVTVCLVENDPAKRAQAQASGTTVFEKLDEALDQNFDLYDICLPTHVHATTIQTILEKTQAYILCEKPLTLDVPQIDMLSKLPGAQTRISGAFVERFHEPFVIMKGWASKQTAPFTMSFSRRTKKPTYAAWFHKPKLGGDILLDLGIHDIDLASWFTATSVTSVSDHTYDDDDHESFRLNYQDGSTADFYFGWDLPKDHKAGIENHVSIKSATDELSYDSTTETLTGGGLKKQTVRPRFPEAYYDELKTAISLASGTTSNPRFPQLQEMRTVMEIIQLVKQDRKA